jgi:membrane-associated phospholipid phosphatase
MLENIWIAVSCLEDPRVITGTIFMLVFSYAVLRKEHSHQPFTRHLKKFLLLLIPTVLLAFAGAEMLKLAFQVPRPCVPCPGDMCNVYCPETFSFPSSHSSTATAFVTALVLVLRKRRYLLLYFLALFVLISRVELGVHTWPDVIGGFALGLAVTLLVWRFRRRIYTWEDETIL